MSARKWQRECLEYAEQIGLRNARLMAGGKHLKLVGTVKGVPFWWPVPHTPNRGPRGRVNAYSSLKRAIRAHQ